MGLNNTIEETMNCTKYELERADKKLDILYEKLLRRERDFEAVNGDVELGSFYLETELYFEGLLHTIDSIGVKLRALEEVMIDYEKKYGLKLYSGSLIATMIEDYRKNEKLAIIQKLLREQRSNTTIHTEVNLQTNSLLIYADPFRIDCPEERFTFQKVYDIGKECVKRALVIVKRG